jgi:hypothetical protein
MVGMWSFWSSKNPLPRVGAIVDVGDRRIEVALVSSVADHLGPSVVWTHVELLSLGDATKAEATIKKAVNNAFASLAKDGVKVLKQLGLPREISLIQASLHAPYAITVSRNVSMRAAKPFKITRSLVSELESKAKADAYEMQSSALVRSGLKLYPLSSAVIALRLNGYETQYPFKSEAAEVSLSQHVILSTLDFLEMLRGARDRYLPGTELDADSFISLFYRTISALAPKVADCSIVTIGDGVTEFMTVREGLPQDTHFMPIGLDHVAQEISKVVGLLPHEARNVTKNGAEEIFAFGGDAKKRAVKDALIKFETELTSLFRKTGDSLALPKPIFLQTEYDHEVFFASMVERVARVVTGTQHTVHPVTSEFFAHGDIKDASLLSLAYSFHKKLYVDRYLDLK